MGSVHQSLCNPKIRYRRERLGKVLISRTSSSVSGSTDYDVAYTCVFGYPSGRTYAYESISAHIGQFFYGNGCLRTPHPC